MGFKQKEKGRRLKLILIVIVCVGLLGSGGWLAWTKFEGSAPEIAMDLDKRMLGAETEISGTISDNRSGVRKIWAGLIQDGSETVLLEETFEAPTAPEPQAQPFTLSINTRKLGLEDGKATLRMAAWDHSWRDWGKGNRSYIEKEIVFDTRAPDVTVLTRQHNIRQGGSGLVAYRLSEDCEKSGIYVGEEFFPGYSGYFSDDAVHLAFFALPYDQGRDTQLYVEAVDAAGNAGRGGLQYYIGEKRFKGDVLTVSDGFLRRKLPEFEPVIAAPADASLIEKFRYVNEKLRQKNNQTLLAHGSSSEAQLHWQGVFGRLPNSARRASFADHRRYQYKGDTVDRAIHMGVDLASVQHAPVPAANAGRVAFAGEIGIYGNTILIDHGYGLFSVYSHLSRFNVAAGDRVDKGEIIGNTGVSGMAGGDHLHYGMFIDHVYVNPVEWWDPAWIENNITTKLNRVKSLIE
mgnify:CR=1 FL=1